MFHLDICPRCQSQIPDERKNQPPVVCSSCGWMSEEGTRKVQKSIDKRFLKVGVITSIFIVGAFIQLVKWDKFFMEVIPYQIKSITGSLSYEDVKTFANICEQRHNAVCVEDLYTTIVRKEPGNIEHLATLGTVQYRRMKYSDAVRTFKQYFDKGGLDFEASYAFAQSLGHVGEVDEASSYYEAILKAKPETFQVTVAQNYVKMLLDNSRRDQALTVLSGIRSLGPNTALFMDTEFKDLSGLPK